MKKIFCVIVLCGIIIFGVCGCSRDNNEMINNSFKDDGNFKFFTTIKGNIENDIVVANRNILIDSNQNLYNYNIRKIFSNDTNYKLIDNGYIGNLSYFLYKNNCEIVNSSLETPNLINQDLIIDNCIYKIINGNILITQENKIYYRINGDFSIFNDSEISDDEKIVAVYETYVSHLIRTDKAFYRITRYKKNKTECEKYADIKCVFEYKIVKDNIFSKYINDIKFIGNDGDYYVAVLKNNDVYRIKNFDL